MIRTIPILFCLFIGSHLSAQISAKLMRYLDVSDTQVVFVYGGDIWVAPKTGGTATQLTQSPGEESWPRFSPDGQSIGFTADYNGNNDVYVVPTSGGLPTRVTHASGTDRMIDWYPDGEHLLFAASRELGQRSGNQLYRVAATGGFAEKLPIPYAELASFSPDGGQLAYITKITENYPFKRYRGGLTSDILIYNTTSQAVERITDNPANDGKPAWLGDKVYFLSDRGADYRLNVWAYDTQSKQLSQLTNFEDFDVSYLAAGTSDLVFEAGGTVYLMDGSSQEYQPIDIDIVSDLSAEIPRAVDVSKRISSATAAPGGKRVVFEARGELFSVPVEHGYTQNLTGSSGAFDRQPAWSPDGKQLAYWSDRSGEYEVWLQPMQGGAARQLTQRNKGFGYTLHWSPDSKKIAFIDETNTIYVVDVASGNTEEAGNTNWNIGHGGRYGFTISWSPDSRWLAFNRGLENAHYAVFIYDTQENSLHQATSGYYQDYRPVFSSDGKYLFYLTDREYDSIYSDMDNTWVYPNATQIVALSLTKATPSLLAARNDTVEVKTEEKKEKEDADKGEDKEEDKNGAVAIDFEGLERRAVLLPPEHGNMGAIMPFEGKLVYLRYPNSGTASGERPKLMVYDFKKREEKTVMERVNSASLTADGKMILVRSGSRFGIIKPEPGQKLEDAIPTDGLTMNLVPREEWNQIFNDTWRRHRDFFYDPEMHGLDWAALRDQYGALLKDARTRWDVSNLQSNLAAELSAGHTYTFGGDTENGAASKPTGMLGINWTLENGKYCIAHIVRGADWDADLRSPLDQPGVDVEAGDCILAVNGQELDTSKDPYAAFEGLSGKTVALRIQKSDGSVQEEIAELLSAGQERNLRLQEWIEGNRKKVAELSDDKLGYIYMSNTSGLGQEQLVKMYYGQLDKQGFIIDERFNGGGQLADRFLELLKRPVVYNLHWRHGRDHTQPIHANTGPMGMLINGWAGSGGDGLPWAFQELEAGPIVGERTLGILVGPATGHQLIDGGGITVPGARLYDNDGHWFWEGEGVKPDIYVWDDPNQLMQGIDPQLVRVVEEVMKSVETQPAAMTPAPVREDRTAKALNDNDK